MKRLLLIAAMAVLTFSGVSTGTVSAWTFTVKGDAVCNTKTGDWDITWTINNPEPEELTVAASDRASVPVGSTVPMNSSRGFNESLPGTTTGDQSLTVEVDWPSDKNQPSETAKVTLDGTCKKPPVVGGKGAGAPEAPQVVKPAPSKGVNAGSGGSVAATLSALAISVLAFVYGALRLRKLNS